MYRQKFSPHLAFDESRAKYRYVCRECGERAWSNHAEFSQTRYVTLVDNSDSSALHKQDDLEVRGVGIGTWHCPGRCKEVKVRREFK